MCVHHCHPSSVNFQTTFALSTPECHPLVPTLRRNFIFCTRRFTPKKAFKGMAQMREIGAGTAVHRDRAATCQKAPSWLKKAWSEDNRRCFKRDSALLQVFHTKLIYSINIWPQSILPSNWFTLKLVYLRQKERAEVGKWEHESPSFLSIYTLLYRLIRTGCEQLSWVCSQGMLQMSFSMMKWWSYHDLTGVLCPSMEKPLMSS